MSRQSQKQLIADLRERIAAVERHPPLAAATPHHKGGTEDDTVPGPMPGILHEIVCDERRNSTAALGFALGLSRLVQSAKRPALIFVQQVFAGRETGLPYGPGLDFFGIDPARLVIVRVETLTELLWTMEEALACRPVAAVLADLGGSRKGPDFSASRRLSLRIASGGGTAVLLRSGRGREASAARLRWHVAPAPSAPMPFDPAAPGAARWSVRLEKGVLAGRQNQEWLLGWTENGFERVDERGSRLAVPGSALPAPLPAQLADRLSQTA